MLPGLSDICWLTAQLGADLDYTFDTTPDVVVLEWGTKGGGTSMIDDLRLGRVRTVASYDQAAPSSLSLSLSLSGLSARAYAVLTVLVIGRGSFLDRPRGGNFIKRSH
jgi:hypothetical protein